MRFEELVNAHKKELGDTDLLVLRYILAHRAATRHISIHTLARACAVSSTTIVRFAKKLGLEGFAELKALLKMEEPQATYTGGDVLYALKDFYARTAERVFSHNYTAASKLVYQSRRVFTFASGYVQQNVVQELKRLFFYDNILFYDIPAREEFYSILSGVTPDDLFIFVSLSGESLTVTELAGELRMRGVPVISITKLHDNTLASISSVNLYVSPAEFPLYGKQEGNTHAPFKSMMPYFLLIEVWYVNYRIYVNSLRQ